MSPIPRLVGMIHLLPLPGSPGYRGSIDEVLETATGDAATLADAGFPALLVENFGDVPFHADTSDPETVAAMTLAAKVVGSATGLPFGVNVLRNDALSALGIAAVTGAAFIRVNVLTGVMYTDQGPIVGRADELARRRAALAPAVEIWADVLVKHATPPPGLDIRQAAEDTVSRGLADAVIVSGSRHRAGARSEGRRVGAIGDPQRHPSGHRIGRQCRQPGRLGRGGRHNHCRLVIESRRQGRLAA